MARAVATAAQEAVEAPEVEERPDPAMVLQAILGMENVADHLEDSKLGEIAEDVLIDFNIDLESMKDWHDKMKAGVDLAKLVKTDKTYPWKDASNIKYPLVTTAALQFNAKAYPAIVAADQIVKAKVFGNDPQGRKAARAERVAAHMSYDLDCNVEEWEEDTDKLLTLLPIVGTVVRKWWYDPAERRKRCRLLLPGAFVVNNKITHLADAPRCSEVLPLYPNEISKRKRMGLFRDVELVEQEGDDRQTVQEFIEQHRLMDLDEDGVEEPYIVTVHKKLRKVARIVADFEAADVKRGPGEMATMIGPMGPQQVEIKPGPVLSIRRGTYFIDYIFLPSMDGGFMGSGLGLLLGDISEAINSAINMMFDAGHMEARGGGFLGSEFRIKGGSHQFKPGEWKMVQASGGAVRDAIVPLTVPGPSDVLFQLLGLLIDAGKEVSSIKDVLTGETGNRTMPVGTTLALIEQGMAQFTAAYKRIFRSLRREFKLVAKMNAQTVTPEEYNKFHDLIGPDGQPVMLDPAQEYDLTDMDIEPVADPSSVTKMQEMAKAQFLGEMAKEGMLNPQAAVARILEAASIPDVEELIPQPDPMAEAMKAAQLALVQAQSQEAQASVVEAQAKAAEAANSARDLEAKVAVMMAELQIKQGEASQRERETDAKIMLIGAQIDKIRAELRMEAAKSQVEVTAKLADVDRADREAEAKRQQAAAKFALERQQAEAKFSLEHTDKSERLRMDREKMEHEARAAGALPAPKAKKKRTRVTKHDERGRIIEFVSEDAD